MPLMFHKMDASVFGVEDAATVTTEFLRNARITTDKFTQKKANSRGLQSYVLLPSAFFRYMAFTLMFFLTECENSDRRIPCAFF